MKIAIIGAGASGLTAAISAARNGASVTMFERNDKVGKKILATGNGKCNLGNLYMSEECYYSECNEFVFNALDKFSTDDTIRFFEGLGLLLTEKKGYLYPYSEQASTVLDALRLEADCLGVTSITDAFVTEIICDNNGLFIINATQKLYDPAKKDKKGKPILTGNKNIKKRFDRVIISTGGKAAPNSGSDGNGYELVKSFGHSITNIYPALIGLRCDGDFWKSIAGVRCQANISIISDGICISSETGELQLTDYGISGIPVFQISRTASKALESSKKVCAEIDFMPELSADNLLQEMIVRYLLTPDRTNEQFYNGFFNKKLAMLLIKKANLLPDNSINKDSFEKVISIAKCFSVGVISDNGYEQAQVSAGGVRLTEITDDFESKIQKGLYMTGELLDVDGKCGGYNLQWAWTSGHIAGEAASSC